MWNLFETHRYVYMNTVHTFSEQSTTPSINLLGGEYLPYQFKSQSQTKLVEIENQ